jgi:hypothetical protein
MSRLSDDQYHLSEMESVIGECVCHSDFYPLGQTVRYKRH